MGSRKRKRRRNSNSYNTVGKHSKQYKYGGKSSSSDLDLGSVLSEANSVLYGDNGDNEDLNNLDVTVDLDKSVFSSPGQCYSFSNSNSNQDTMAGRSAEPVLSDSEKLTRLLSAVESLHKSQDGLKKTLESKIDKLRNDMKCDIDAKIKGLQDDISLTIGREASRIDKILTTVQSLQKRISDIEVTDRTGIHVNGANPNNGDQSTDGQDQRPYTPRHTDDSDISVVVSGVKSEQGENLMQKAQCLIDSLSNDVSSKVTITKAIRFKSRIEDRPGLVKTTFRNLDEKILVLRNKMSL